MCAVLLYCCACAGYKAVKGEVLIWVPGFYCVDDYRNVFAFARQAADFGSCHISRRPLSGYGGPDGTLAVAIGE